MRMTNCWRRATSKVAWARERLFPARCRICLLRAHLRVLHDCWQRIPCPAPDPRPVAHRCSLLLHREIFPWPLGFGAFAVGQVAFDQFPLQVWSRLVARHCRKMNAKSLHYRRGKRS